MGLKGFIEKHVEFLWIYRIVFFFEILNGVDHTPFSQDDTRPVWDGRFARQWDITWRIIPVNKQLGSPPFASHSSDLRGELPYLGDFLEDTSSVSSFDIF